MRSRTLAVLLLFCLMAIAGAVIAISSALQRSSWDDPVEQWAKIKFSHKYHLTEVGAECSTCHAMADTSARASDVMFPKHEECSVCHSEQVESDCKYCHLDPDNPEAFAAPKREVIFSHKLHLQTQKLECAACHAGIEQSEKPSVAFLPVMASCNTCHNDMKATNACESCHTRVETLLPLSHREVMWAKEHKRLVHVAGMSNDCTVCHSDNFCQTCHAEATTQLTVGDPIRSVSENRPMPSGKQALVKQNVHELNYLYSHGIDFRGKQSDCYSCHNQQTFCADCHARNQDAGFASPVPFSHRASDFMRLGVGSGGGQHATSARQDLESCASCHDVEGRDPTCITCHVDRIPGRGNDPKTHPASFRNENGEWHSDQGSLCYNCHTNTNMAGIGFCGYCHGVK